MHSCIPLIFALSSISNQAAAFTTTLGTKSVISPPFSTSCVTIPQHRSSRRFHLFSSTDSTKVEDEVKSMRVGAIKQELESYGISTRTFLEKSELVDALVSARKEGKTPMSTQATPTTTTASSSSSTSSATEPSSSSTTSTTAPTNPEERQQRIKEEQDKCKSMKVGELKSELELLGVSTKSFFEKSEFVRALAEARVDGVKKSKKKKRRTVTADDDEVEEVTAKVEVITNDSVGPKTKKSRDNSAESTSAGGNPFGGGGGGRGMGGMDIGDILKNMGGMGGGGGAAGGNPFAGAGGGANPFAGAAGGANPFGGGAGMEDAMKAAQAAMGNPKVQKVLQKAQSNPKVMQAVQECMSNPMAMTKYMSDPEVGPILKELQEAMM
ncbi:hypothetical protein QTG54_005015 [Skeletonema marinoi]|uniref:STI1 domain-containing protein n=2 Tax=Skeletonema marinoi TaxID=267567 RepID=A0AAD8YE26_9STRA|nr:hypothetical protein QTG54_005015 [Skeletonema marinoi]